VFLKKSEKNIVAGFLKNAELLVQVDRPAFRLSRSRQSCVAWPAGGPGYLPLLRLRSCFAPEPDSPAAACKCRIGRFQRPNEGSEPDQAERDRGSAIAITAMDALG